MEDVKMVNALILSMVAKQKALDQLKSEIFTIEIFSHYIETLLLVNVRLMGLDESSVEKYKDLINLYIIGVIKAPEEIIARLQTNI